MIHILALAGFAIMILLPVTLGAIIFAPLPAWEKLWAFIGIPFASVAAGALILFGWGDWPDLGSSLPDGFVYRATEALVGVGLVMGIVVRVKANKIKREARVSQG